MNIACIIRNLPLAGRWDSALGSACVAGLACFVAAPASGQFNTVLNLPPDTIASNTTIGSDTQVNFFAGGSMGSGVRFGDFNGTSTNIEFNLFGGLITNANLYAGSTTNISGGTASWLSTRGADRLAMTSGIIDRLELVDGSTVFDLSGGTINDIDFWIADENIDPTFNIGGGSVTAPDGLGFLTFDGPINGGTLNLTGGTFNGGQFAPSFIRDATLTGGTFNGQLIVYGGSGVLDGSTFNGGVSSGNGGTLTVLSGSAGSVGASTGGITHVQGDVGLTGLSFSDGGTINLNSGDLNLDQLFINTNGWDPTTSTLNLNTGTVVIDEIYAQGPGRDHVLAFNVDGSDVTIPTNYFTVHGLNIQLNISSGSLSGPVGSSNNLLPARNLTMTGGRLGDNFHLTGIRDEYGVVSISNATIGDGFAITSTSGGFYYQESIYLDNATIGHRAGFDFHVQMTDTTIGNEASFASLTMNGGSIGDDAVVEGMLQINSGTIGDRLNMSTEQPTILNDGVIGNDARISGLTMHGGSIGNGAQIYEHYDYSMPGLHMNAGTIGDNAEFFADAQVDNGTIGHNARFEAGLQLNGGSIGDDAQFNDFNHSSFAPRIQITGGSIGARAEFYSEVQIDAGTIGDEALFRGTTVINGGTIGDNAQFNGGNTIEINGGVIGNDASITRHVVIRGGMIGDRLTMPDSDAIILYGSAFFLDGVDIGSGLNVGHDMFINDREVTLTGTLDSGTPFDLFLSEDPNNMGITDYFRFTDIIIVKTEGHILGDINGDGALTNGDISPFVLALTDPDAYEAVHPGLYADNLGDFTGDGQLTNGDIAGFVAALTGGSAGLAVPEPGSLAALLGGGLLLGLRRRRHRLVA